MDSIMTDCAIIGKFGTENLALAVESHNILIIHVPYMNLKTLIRKKYMKLSHSFMKLV